MTKPLAHVNDRFVSRLWDATDGARGWLVAFGIVAAFGLGLGCTDLHDRNVARDVVRDGSWVTVSDVRVHVDHEPAKGGGWYEVDGVRARLPGSDGLVDLEAVANAGTLPDTMDWQEGWQEPTATTGYDGTLRVRVQTDGEGAVRHAVAEPDVTYWTGDNIDPEIGIGIGLSFLALMALTILINVLRLRRLRALRMSGSYPGSTRSERRDARDRDVTGAWSAGKGRRRQGT